MKLYHYTSLEAALNIIGKENLCFHGSRYDCMNDPTDFIFARDTIIPCLKERYGEKDLEDAINPYPYIVSFCKSEDDPLMWRLYKSEVALVVDSDKFPIKKWDDWDKKNVSDIYLYGDVEYATTSKEVIDKAEKLKEKRANKNDNEIDNFMNAVVFIKHKSYEVENEYRLARYDYDSFEVKYNERAKDKCDIYEGEIFKDVKVRDVKNGDIRLYKDFFLPKESLEGIIVHTYDPIKFESIRKHLLLLHQMKDINPTKVSIRPTKAYPTIY